MPRFALSIWLDLGSELKILAGSMNGIDRRSVYRAANGGALARKNAREREREKTERSGGGRVEESRAFGKQNGII